jgi:hypothetical protein
MLLVQPLDAYFNLSFGTDNTQERFAVNGRIGMET